MDQKLDMQVAALIFLAGTRCLVTSNNSGDVETTSEDGEDSEEPAPLSILEKTRFPPLVPLIQSFPMDTQND
jgi:hypothetical protein